MLEFLNAYGLLIGIIAGVLGIIAFVESRRHAIFRQPGTVSGVVFTSLCLIALTAGLMTKLSSQGYTAGTSQPGTSSNTSPGTNYSSTSTPTLIPSPKPSPTPSPTPQPKAGDILYQTNQSWSGWSGSKEWNALNGMLTNDGTGYPGAPTIIAPYEIGVSDYAVEASVQVVNWHRCCYSQFAIVVRASTNSYGSWQGYSVGEDLEDRTPSTAEISAHAGDFGSSLGYAPFDPGAAWHSYRIEVKGNTIKLLIDGGVKLAIMDNTYLSGGQVGFWSYEVQLNISSFKIIAL